MAEPAITNASGITRVTLKTTVSAKVGDLIGHDGTDWVLADADARIFARFAAMETVAAGSAIAVCQSGVLFDSDAPYTAGAAQYLSATAGAHGAIPAVSATLTAIQRVGHAISTDTMVFDLARGRPDILRASAAVNPASGATDTVQDLAVTITGLLAADYIYPHPPALAQGVIYNGAAVPTADTVTLGIANPSAGTVDGASLTWTFYVERP